MYLEKHRPGVDKIAYNLNLASSLTWLVATGMVGGAIELQEQYMYRVFSHPQERIENMILLSSD